MLLSPANPTPSFLIRDLGGHRRAAGQEVGVAALNEGCLMDLEKLLPKPDLLLGPAAKGRPERRRGGS